MSAVAPLEQDYSHLPAAVRAQALRSDELLRQSQANDPNAPPASGSAPETPVNEWPPTAPVPATDAVTTAAAGEDWKQRYSVLQGKYNAEVPRLSAEITYLTGENATMKRRIADLEQMLAEAGVEEGSEDSGGHHAAGPEHPATPPAKPKVDIDSIRDMFGDELADGMQAFAADMEAREAEKAQRQQEAFYGTIQAAINRVLGPKTVPWNQVNVDPGFMQWLQQRDPYTGKPLQELLNEAAGVLNGERAAAFFSDYLLSKAPPAQPAPTPNGGGAAGVNPAARLHPLIEPSAAGGAGNPVTGDQKIWSKAEITQFYKDCSTGKYRGREQESERIDREISQAALDGRVR